MSEAELEAVLYEILSKQAQIILNLDNLANAGPMDIQLVQQANYGKQVEHCLDQKRELYEQFILHEINLEEYKAQKAAVDGELVRLKRLHTAICEQNTQRKMDSEAKSVRRMLAQEITSENGLTAALVDALIDRVYVYPDNQVKIVWKMKDFCTSWNG